jgi:DNA-directed RNA polymerase specialized sigma subunit
VLCAIRQRKSKSFEARTKAETIIDRYIAEEVPLVRGMLFKHYGSLVAKMGIVQDDVEQIARIGIWQALASYDGKRGMALSSWTYSKCRWVFNSHISEGSLSSRHVYVSPHKVAQAFGYAPEKGRKKLTENEVEEIRHALTPVSIDDPLFAGESRNTIHDRIASRSRS